ncbi:MAG: DUF4175 family protein [Myxococcales bacterium]
MTQRSRWARIGGPATGGDSFTHSQPPAALDVLLEAGSRRVRTARIRAGLGLGLSFSGCWALLAALLGNGLGAPGVAWGLVALPLAAAVVAALWPTPPPASMAGRLRLPSSSLRSAVRSAVELRAVGESAQESHRSPSAALIAAHFRQTSGLLGGVDVRRVLPAALAARLLAGGLGVVLLDLLLATLGPPSLAAGFRALAAPVGSTRGSVLREPITGDIELTLLYPAHTRLAPRTVSGTDGSIDAPAGTEVRLRTRADRDVVAAAAVVNGKAVPLTVRDRRDLSGSFFCLAAGSYFFRFSNGHGRVLAEGAPIPIALQADAPPQIVIESPGSTREVDPKSIVPLRWRADDDYGLSEVALLYRAPGAAADTRVVLRRAAEAPRHLAGESSFDLGPLGLGPGDKVSYTLEALDNDGVSGPKAGRARAQTLEVFSAAEHHEEALRQARAAWEKLLALLADRLDEGTARAAASALPAGEEIDRRAFQLCAEMEQLARKLRKDTLSPPALGAALANVARSERGRASTTLDAREGGWRLTSRGGQSPRSLAVALGAEIEGLERDVLYLEALLDRQAAQDLVSLAHELASRRRQLADMLEKYRTARTPELRAAITAQLQRLRERVQELFARMSELVKSLSDEHVNGQAVAALAKKEPVGDSLAEIQKKLAEGDVDGALAALDRLGGSLDDMEQGLRSAGGQGQQYPELARKLQDLQHGLHALAEQQRRVEGETAGVRQRYRQQAEKRSPVTPEAIARLKQKVAAARDQLAQIPDDAAPQGSFGSLEDPLGAARDGVDALGRALDARDFDEALRMSEKAAVGARAIAEGLSREDDILGAYGGASAAGARLGQRLNEARGHARAALPPIEEIHDALSKLFPSEDRVLSPADRRRLGELAQEQARLRQKLGQVQNALQGVQKTAPLFDPSAAQKLEQAGGEMAGAQDALGSHEAGKAVRHERGALEQLDGLEQAMKKMGGKSGGSGGFPLPLAASEQDEAGPEEGSGWNDEHEKVAIPGADQYRVPPEFRRDILDAMKQKPPPQYEDQVKQYYREIVR